MKSTGLLILCCALLLAALSQNAHPNAQFWAEVVECESLEELNELERFVHDGFVEHAHHRCVIQSRDAITLTHKPIDQRLFILQQTLLI